MEKRANNRTLQMAQLAILIAVQLIMSFTPLGYLHLGPLSVTFLTLPIAIAAVILGTKASLTLGVLFGLTSFFQCFGMDQIGVALMGISPFRTAVMCIVPRVFVGLLPGLIYQGLKKHNEKVAVGAACLSAPLINTCLFLGAMILLFGKTDVLAQFGNTVWAILTAMGISNAIPEALVCLILGSAICIALQKALRRKN